MNHNGLWPFLFGLRVGSISHQLAIKQGIHRVCGLIGAVRQAVSFHTQGFLRSATGFPSRDYQIVPFRIANLRKQFRVFCGGDHNFPVFSPRTSRLRIRFRVTNPRDLAHFRHLLAQRKKFRRDVTETLALQNAPGWRPTRIRKCLIL